MSSATWSFLLSRYAVLPGVANLLGEAGLDVHVHVLQVRAPRKLSLFYLVQHLLQAVYYLACVLGRDNPLLAEHPRVDNAACDVIAVEALVKGDGLRKLLDELVRRLREPPAPRLFLAQKYPPKKAVLFFHMKEKYQKKAITLKYLNFLGRLLYKEGGILFPRPLARFAQQRAYT
jgi:hypothetical protein